MALRNSQKSLKDWTSQNWRTSDGTKSKGKKRYLPDAAWKALSPAEKAATNRAKAKGNKPGPIPKIINLEKLTQEASEGKSLRELAKMFDVSKDTISTHLKRAKGLSIIHR